MIKRDGFYYLLVARTGPHKAQFAYRSKSLYGPYESKLIFEDKSRNIQAAQGSLVPVTQDAWAFIHHDYRMESPYGRLLHLQPAGWRDGWPWIGIDPDGDGIGEPVAVNKPYPKPDLPPQPVNPASHSDEFKSTHLGGQWMWNHDPDDDKWSLTARPGWLRLTASPLNTHGGFSQYPRTEVAFHEDHLLFARNTAVQRICGRVCSITTRVDSSRMADGQRAGLCTLIDDYTWIGVACDQGVKRIVFMKGDPSHGPATRIIGPILNQKDVWFRLDYHAAKGTLSYSLDGITHTPLGDRDYAYSSSWYEGTKAGLFSYQLSNARTAGSADFDFFRQDHDGPKPANP
jgi:beta-xylosidase